MKIDAQGIIEHHLRLDLETIFYSDIPRGFSVADCLGPIPYFETLVDWAINVSRRKI